jgi:uncharacterized caspase-like protein
MKCLVLVVAAVATLAAQQDRGVRVEAGPSGRRLALVIGNGNYASSPLANPVNDATDVAETLRALKFDVVQLATNTTKVELQRAINVFVALVENGDVVLFYYSGHGVQIGGENYLLPIDYAAQDEAEARFEAYSAALLHDRLGERGARLKILILDACRNNPFRASRSVGAGLAAMAAVGKGTFIAFATGPNNTADDNPRGRNGLFTTYLLEAIRQPGLTLEQVLSRVRVNVDAASGGRQTPWANSSVIGDFYFQSKGQPPPGPPLPLPHIEQYSAPVDPKTGVLQALAAYRAAYENMDTEALRRVYPSFSNVQALKQRFADLQSVAVAMGSSNVTINPDGTATATCLYSMTFTAQTGRNESTKPARAEFKLRKNGAAWIIENIAYR